MSEIIKKIAKEYPLLTSELKEINPCEYELGIILSCKNELDKGYKFESREEVTENGTVLNFVYCEKKEELVSASKIVFNMIDDFKKKYDGWDLAYILK